jgi:hypothetical protein
MIDVYAIGATLKLTDLVTPQLMKLSEQFEKVDALAAGVTRQLKAMGAEVAGVKDLIVAASKLDRGLKGVGDQAIVAEKRLRAINGAIPTAGIGLERELNRANIEADALEKKLAAMRALGRSPGGGAMPPLIPGAGGGGGRGGGHGGRIHGGNLHVGSGGIGVGGVGVGLMSDMLIPLAAGMGAAYVGHQFYESSKEYQNEFNRFKALNLGDQVNEEADKFVKSTHTFGISSNEMMKGLSESVGLFGSFAEAEKYTPKIMQLAKANASIFGEKGQMDEEGMNNLLLFLDRRGAFKDEASFDRELDLAERLKTGSGNKITDRDLGSFSQMGGTAFRALSDKGLEEMAALMIEQGGSKAGTSLMSGFQNLIAGRTTKKGMEFAASLGLGKMSEVKAGTVNGKPSFSTIFVPDPVFKELMMHAPVEAMQQIIVPALEKNGLKTNEQLLDGINKLFSNRTASNQESIMGTQELQVARDFKLVDNSLGTQQVQGMYKKSASGAEDDFAAAWTDFKNQFGKTILPAITNMLKDGADILRTIANAAQTTPVKTASDATGSVLHAFAWPYRAISSMFGGSDNSHASTSVAGNSGNSSGNVHTTINVDGRKLAQAVTPYIAGPLGSGMYIGGVDPNVSLPMPALK